MLIGRQFEKHWNFPHCIGAMDGKHIVIQASNNTGSDFFNYKGDFSIVLLALVHANYKFTAIDAPMANLLPLRNVGRRPTGDAN
ncbi:unnamed protein product [Acanthoscelides obtectus]|uniref:DDE Tnp4 domain-containing protein n=1 Tax=Acanthoscelides obtectus TaxID=200917 RepID=A0A9P0KI37_ACAOB|nr:unnamed protein product [Acanthoscelides obtectus]CAK1654527.1 hypothetical protein AOBTE_LOCUS18658 [Acanthoscelides obtectus]